MNQSPLTQCLIDNKLIKEDQLQQSIQQAVEQQKSLINFLAANQIVNPNKLQTLLADFFNLPTVNLTTYDNKQLPIDHIPNEVLITTNILPLEEDDNTVTVAIADPSDLSAIETIKFHCHKTVIVNLANYQQLQKKLKEIGSLQNNDMLHKIDTQTEETEPSLLKEDDEPLVRFVNDTIKEAIDQHISDIHFEVYEKTCRVRFRKDGLLEEISRPPKQIAPRLATRLKIMSKLDIAEKRKSQDGRCTVKFGEKTMDVRVNCCPTLFGEKIVLRLLDSQQQLRGINKLGMNEEQLTLFKNRLNQPQGLILVTGPTGSGKTMTLYGALQYLNHPSKNISTVEDPVEINFPGINQVNINQKANINFATILRAFLRQDPDILMLGEIRDLETAEIAIRAAETGHLVLSTLHTNSAMQALTRLHNMGVAPHNMASAVTLITAQRLLRKLCPHCKKSTLASTALCQQLGLSKEQPIFKAQKCDHCLNGYIGRAAIHEVLPISESSFIHLQKNLLTMKEITFTRLQERAIELIKNGITSAEEVTRTIQWNL